MKKRILIGILIFICLSPLVVFYVINTGKTNYKNALQRTENDFTTENFEIAQIWELKKVKTKGITGEDILKSYIFIKPQNELFNLRFADADYNNRDENKSKILSQILEGETISVKVLKSQLEDARKDGIFKQIKRFIQGDKREVTIYKLVDKGVTVSERSINEYDAVESDFMNGLERIALISAFIIIPFVIYIRRKIFSKGKQH